MIPAELLRVRFSAREISRLRGQAKELGLPLAALVRAFCRAPLTEEQLRAALTEDDIKPGLKRGHRFGPRSQNEHQGAPANDTPKGRRAGTALNQIRGALHG